MRRVLQFIYSYLTAGSQPQAVMLPRLHAAVTAYVTPAELIAYVKAASLLPASRHANFRNQFYRIWIGNSSSYTSNRLEQEREYKILNILYQKRTNFTDIRIL